MYVFATNKLWWYDMIFSEKIKCFPENIDENVPSLSIFFIFEKFLHVAGKD